MSAARPFPTPSVPSACPDPTLHRVAEAPLRPLSDLLEAAVLFVEATEDYRTSETGWDAVARRTAAYDTLKAAVERLS